ncbi:radical SAM enzyme, Cfr family [Pseudothermotoga lettingae TMO]|uniref:Probable dual-specificity RNA methyltransferase RlmN n=2 Tax=Thermotogaceae TaxID=188709 RepID=RLMN_PSELT|nr:RecName: Full=Probable dual-specificity RNA methyltransferase RlmN; AltName: Full=23S rRNA (adenine(2503)-C(2))-methyltransferase; AltName: Full=23S rRNA m2A2503 methyltransferase; AltName: Full=Ribosomal RNA large subunit methyltransferase N; AltName: Full=tRNA (adenine(37)-C(2))-methyltransferase; AltName: Full=tRNA m2A37 methyltransferase [Pseudothermotoga lettingae TMO]ABV34406.1 radical SAM enzyme, Cfr family [Pseudothermotoga lettingae TMO]GLI48649.1 putative dual-specificity RNA methylt
MNILSMTYEKFVQKIQELGLEKYRADQILDWIYKKHVFVFEQMTNLSKQHRSLLRENFCIQIPKIVSKRVSSIDKTTKYLYELSDGNTIESVLLFHEGYATACISTQIGCPVKCSFCATGQSGFVRNLDAGEIVSQILAIEKDSKQTVRNIVYMGMGEPLLNYDNVIKSIKILIDKKTKNIGIRRVTLSTVGIPEMILKLSEERLDLNLAISLHASTNEKRDQIIPINRKYSIQEIINAAKNYQERSDRRLTIEYILIKEFNDFDEDARKLAKLLNGLKVFVNLIPVNSTFSNFEKPAKWKINRFKEILINSGIEAEIRYEKGADIEAACGQLRIRNLLSKQL